VSDIVAAIEAEAERILEEARRKAQEVLIRAKALAEAILSDDSYKRGIEEEVKLFRARIEEEVRRIVTSAEEEAKRIKAVPEEALVRVAKRIASLVAGVNIE
jgi:cell division septum initiation protein DivIVA